MFSFEQRIKDIHTGMGDLYMPILINSYKNKEHEVLNYFRTATLSELDRIALACPTIILHSNNLASEICKIRNYRGAELSTRISTTPCEIYTRELRISRDILCERDRKAGLIIPIFFTDCTIEIDNIFIEHEVSEDIL